MTTPTLDIERDALDVAHSVYTGDFDAYADIVEKYTDDRTPAGQLIFQLAFLIKKAAFSCNGLYDEHGFYEYINQELNNR